MMILKRNIKRIASNLLFLILVIFLINFISASAGCDSGQIDINSASLEDLDKITGVGPVIAQNIIDTRPFNSIDELINVLRIGEITLQKIKDQGLACIEEREKEEEIENDSEEEPLIEENEELPIENPPSPIEPETIKLNSKDIKSEENSEKLDKSKYAVYGFAIFCVLILFLFIFKKFRLKKHGFE